MDHAKEKLKIKTEKSLIGDNFKEVARICINNMDALMSESKCQKDDLMVISEVRLLFY